MYQPKICEKYIRALYRLARARKVRMTTAIDNILRDALGKIEGKKVCKVCKELGFRPQTFYNWIHKFGFPLPRDRKKKK